MYQHKEIVKGCRAHPGDIVEAGPLAVSNQQKQYLELKVYLLHDFQINADFSVNFKKSILLKNTAVFYTFIY